MTDTEITEAYFVARGCFIKQQIRKEGENKFKMRDYWCLPDGEFIEWDDYGLPKILESYSAFKEHVLEVMGGENFRLTMSFSEVSWITLKGPFLDRVSIGEKIKGNDILHAAVIAATRYFEGKRIVFKDCKFEDTDDGIYIK